MNSNGKTFDLFNRGGQTSTNAISLRGYKTVIWLGEGTSVMSVVQKDSVKAYLNSASPSQKVNLFIFAEDIGYQFGRSASSYYDLDFMNNYLGANYFLDRPGTTGNHGLIGVNINIGKTDSTVGTFPDVLSKFNPADPNLVDLYKFRFDNSINAIGKYRVNHYVATFGVDLESLRPAIDSPPGSPIARLVNGAFVFTPVELTLYRFCSGNNVVLNWSTATEVNNSGFQVERKSNNGNYISVGFVQGKGTTTEEQNYMFAQTMT